MTALWPWLAVAGLGALHGLSPANGWMFAAACGVQARDGTRARRALWPIAIGHMASVALVACAVARGLSLDRALVQALAGALLVSVAAYRLLRGTPQKHSIGTRMGHAGIALWSFLMATAHGAGLMLVPALVPLCLTHNPAREIAASGSFALILIAVGLHLIAMLLTMGTIASGVCRGVANHPRLLNGAASRRMWTMAQGIIGMLLIATR